MLTVSASEVVESGIIGTLCDYKYTSPEFALWLFSHYLDAKEFKHEDREVYGAAKYNSARTYDQIYQNPQIYLNSASDAGEVIKLIYPKFASYTFIDIKPDVVGYAMQAVIDEHKLATDHYAFIDLDSETLLVMADARIATLIKLALP